MKPKWLIEDFERDNSFGELAEEVKRQGMEVRTIRYEPFESGKYDFWPGEECVLFQGSINLARQLQREKQWIPGPIANWNNFLCRRYYTHYGQFLLNSSYMMMPFAEFWRRRGEVQGQFEGSYFIRPDGGTKSFTGQVIDSDMSPNMWKYLQSETDPEELVILSKERMINHEWRFICSAENGIITASRYKTHGRSDYQPGAPEGAVAKAKEVLATGWYPDPIFALDICQSGDRFSADNFYLMEIGAFSVAGLYKCDLSKIVQEASRIAWKEYKEY